MLRLTLKSSVAHKRAALLTGARRRARRGLHGRHARARPTPCSAPSTTCSPTSTRAPTSSCAAGRVRRRRRRAGDRRPASTPSARRRGVAAVPGVDGGRSGDIRATRQLVGKDGDAIGPATAADARRHLDHVADAQPVRRSSQGSAPRRPTTRSSIDKRGAATAHDSRSATRITVLAQGGSARVHDRRHRPRSATPTASGGATVVALRRCHGASGCSADAGPVRRDRRRRRRRASSHAAAAPTRIAAVAARPASRRSPARSSRRRGAGPDRRGSSAFFKTFLLVFAVIALFVGAFIIYNTFSIIVAQRTREMALLRALGASRRQVLRSVLLEAVVDRARRVGRRPRWSGIGVAIGLQALLAAFGIDLPTRRRRSLPRHDDRRRCVVGIARHRRRRRSRRPGEAVEGRRRSRRCATRRSTASARSRRRSIAGVRRRRRSARRAARLGLFGGRRQRARSWSALGAVLMFVGVAVLGPLFARPLAAVIGSPARRARGMTGALARENAMRNPQRTASTAAALMIGLGLVGVRRRVARVAEGLGERHARSDADVGLHREHAELLTVQPAGGDRPGSRAGDRRRVCDPPGAGEDRDRHHVRHGRGPGHLRPGRHAGDGLGGPVVAAPRRARC